MMIELKADNGKQFEAQQIQSFFKENNIHQVFTHPYTPEENGHCESFHSILSKSISLEKFTSLQALEMRLDTFYSCYSNNRSHSGTKGIPPAKFWALNDMDLLAVKQTPYEIRSEAKSSLPGYPHATRYL
jgi:putative transposase